MRIEFQSDDLYLTLLNYAGEDDTPMFETVAKGMMVSPSIENSPVTNL